MLIEDIEDQAEPAVELSPTDHEVNIIAQMVNGIQITSKAGEPQAVIITQPINGLMSHIRPLYVRATLDGVPMPKVLVDNGAAINVLPTSTMKKWGRTEKDLVPTDVMVSSFIGDVTNTRGILPLKVEIGLKKTLSAFFVVESRASYNALLGRDWIHTAGCLPFSMHQALILRGREGPEVIAADPSPFVANMHAVEVFYYVEGVGPHPFLGIDKYGRPMQAAMTTEFTITEWKAITKELSRPKDFFNKRPLERQYHVEEVSDSE